MRYYDICNLLKSVGIDNAEHEASLLLERFCGLSPAELLISKDKVFDCAELYAAIQKRASHYPLQYILGECYFYDEKYRVNENCLIPRSDTEILVELAIERLPKDSLFADMCTGSGCIAVSVLAHRQDCTGVALELYEDTLKLAEENAKLNKVSERFLPICCDVLKNDPILIDNNTPQFDAILSNPPYIRSSVIESLETEVQHEPRAALDGGEDGLIFYRSILSQHASLLKEDGFIAFEIGYDQGEQICTLANEFSFSCEIIRDFGGNDRVAFLKKNI
ncbi:MAG: peptide chain release factor N(5)-glutamine methyltransferase [Clostridia bacterium]|nr:peptide chain release factor N(5)-glutamine methyltransferase [Clostridia bacterium]